MAESSCSTSGTGEASSVPGDQSDQSLENEDDEEQSERSERSAVSLLSRLRAPTPSELSRKRKCVSNPPSGKRKSRGSNRDTAPKNIKPEQRVREYAKEPFVVSNGALFCRGCREEISVKSSSIKNHCHSAKHLEGKRKLETKQAREQDIAKALSAYNREVHPRGETLPASQQVFRVKVVRTFLRAGVPLSKIHHFRDLLEETAFRLTDRRFMLDLIPFILKEEEAAIKNEISGKDLGVIFDGTTRFGEALVIVLRYVSDSWTLEQRLVRMHLLSKSVTGEELARELIHTLSANYAIGPNRLLAAMKDRASVNAVAMRTVQIVYPNVLSIGCFSHTIDRVGEHFQTPTLSEFGTAWLMLFSHSAKTKLLWKEQTGKAMASYSATRWWSKWEIFHQLLVSFGDIQPFLEKNVDQGSASRRKLLSILQDTQKCALLKMELAAIIDYGEPFVKGTYKLEGDGPLVFTCYEEVQVIVNAIHTENIPNVRAVAESISPVASVKLQLLAHAKNCIKPGLDYFQQQLQTSLKAPLEAFKAARFFSPYKLSLLRPSAADIDSLSSFPFIKSDELLSSLKAELSTYLAKVDGIDSNTDCMKWWKECETTLPTWAAIAKKILVTQPSSTAAERVFSLLNSSFGSQQDSSLKDYIESSLMLRYNNR